jgi:3' terminal RNA ribose 2'-O-methyltransferase Hen1
MLTAISKVYGTAMAGRCDKRPELAQAPLPFEARISSLAYRGDASWIKRVFEPLGYDVSYESSLLDEEIPEWGDSRYVNLALKGNVRLQSLLKHLHVLISIFDRIKRYWIGQDEVEKLLKHGEGWLEVHPEKEFIASRYVGGKRGLSKLAMDGLNALSDEDEAVAEEEEAPKVPSLNTRRYEAVLGALRDAGACSVKDTGAEREICLKL